MADEKHSFEVGDEVRGKNSQLIGVILKILDAGYLMIRESEFDMEMNVHSSEVVKTTLSPLGLKKTGIPKDTDKTGSGGAGLRPERGSGRGSGKKGLGAALRVDLHWEKLPKRNRNAYSSPIEAQIAWCREQLARGLREGVKEVTIIHGKGSGALHKRVMALLKTYAQIKEVEVLKAALEDAHGVKVRLR
ncbi:MAG: Smr/MutS family protein [Bacteroidia bacterium]